MTNQQKAARQQPGTLRRWSREDIKQAAKINIAEDSRAVLSRVSAAARRLLSAGTDAQARPYTDDRGKPAGGGKRE